MVVCGHVSIGDYTFIGAGTTISNHVTIGKNVIIGIGTVVTKDVPDNVSVIGNPMRIIKNNLREYEQDIINGEFNLNYLDYSFLIKKKEMLNFLYIKNGYELSNLDNIFTHFNISDNVIPNLLYYVSDIDYKKKINLNNNLFLVAYSYDWISLISCNKKHKLIKGFINDNVDKPFIQETEKNTLENLKTSCYLYVINDTSCFTPIITKNYIYKYKCKKPILFLEKIFIENIYNKLVNMKIKIIKYK